MTLRDLELRDYKRHHLIEISNSLTPERGKKLRNLIEYINALGAVAVEFSGGGDSTLLAFIAHAILEHKSVAIMLDSPTLPMDDRARCMELAAKIGMKLIIVKDSELRSEEFRKNPKNRCYFCRKFRDQVLKEKLKELGLEYVLVDGANASDLQDFRPGLDAAAEADIKHPFIECNITKEDIRAISKAIGLETWNLPSSACLASRIAHGIEVSAEYMAMIDNAENMLRKMGFHTVRVRMDAPFCARIEVGADEIGIAFGKRHDIVNILRNIGFRAIALDLEGYIPAGIRFFGTV